MTLEKAVALLSLPREVAKHPETKEPILASLGRYGPYVQHGKTYANLGKDDDVLEIGANRAIDLIVAKESGLSGRRFGGGPQAGRLLGEHPKLGGPVTVKGGRFGPYVTHAKVNATLPKDADPTTFSLEDAVPLLEARASGAGKALQGRLLGDHPSGGPVTVREGRFGSYVNWGKVNATLGSRYAPDTIGLDDALALIEAKDGAPAKPGSGNKGAKPMPAKGAGKGARKPAGKAVGKGPATKAAAKKAAPKRAAAKKSPVGKAAGKGKKRA